MAKKNVKAHKRYDPRINRKVEVNAYSRNQRSKQFKNLQTKSKDKVEYRGFYTGKPVGIGELMRVDQTLANMSEDDREWIMDSLPQSKNPRKAPYIHKSNLGYNVLNITNEDIQGFDPDIDYNRLTDERDSLYKKLEWVDNKIALRNSQIRKIEKKNPAKAEYLQEEIRELEEDQETIGEKIDDIDEKIDSLEDDDQIAW